MNVLEGSSGSSKGLADGRPTRLKGTHGGGSSWTERYVATVTVRHAWEFQMCPYLGMSAFSRCEEGPHLLEPGCTGRVALVESHEACSASLQNVYEANKSIWACVCPQAHPPSCRVPRLALPLRSLSFTRITTWMRNPKFPGLCSHCSGNKKQSGDLVKMGRPFDRSLRG